jgi:hypothetical protein
MPAHPAPVPAGNGIILARMSRRQLSEMAMKLNVDPSAQKTEIHESAQVALDDVTFKVPLAAAATTESLSVRDLSAFPAVTLRNQQVEERFAEFDQAKSGESSAPPRPDVARQREPVAGDVGSHFRAVAPAATPAPATSRPVAATTQPVVAFTTPLAADPMDQPIEVLIVVQSPQPAAAPAPVTAQPADPAPSKDTTEAKK